MINLSSSTDSPEMVRAALEDAGMSVEAVDTITNEPEPTKPPETPAPVVEDKPADAAGAPEVKAEEVPAKTEEPGKKGEPKDGGFQKRIDELTAKYYEEKGRAEQLKADLEAARTQPKPEPKVEDTPPVVEPPKVEPKQRPKLEDFADKEDQFGEYMEALTDWKVEQNKAVMQKELEALRAELVAKDKDSIAAAEAAERADDWNARVETAKAKYTDWDAVAQAATAETAPISAAMGEAIQEDPAGPDIVYYLAKNHEEAQRVFKATNYDPKTATPAQVLAANRRAGIELARISALVSKPETAAAPKTEETKPTAKAQAATARPSNAPAPVTPVKPSAGAISKDPQTMTTQEFLQWREQQIASRRRPN